MPFDADTWQRTASSDGDAPPDGHYDAELIDSTIITANADARQWVKLTWKVLAGAQRDESWESWHTIDSYKPDGETNPGLAFTIDTLRKIEVDVDEIRSEDSLKAAIKAQHGRGYDVEIKRSGRFVNTYPQIPLDRGSSPAPANGNARQPANAIYGGDGPAQQQQPTLAERGRQSRDPVPTGVSDATPADAASEYAPKQGDVNPDTNAPFRF